MKLAFKVLLLVVLIVIGKLEKQNQVISKPTKNFYSPVYSQNTSTSGEQNKMESNNIQKISVKYNNY